MYAIIDSCGKQYKVSEGDVVFFEKLDAEEGKTVSYLVSYFPDDALCRTSHETAHRTHESGKAGR